MLLLIYFLLASVSCFAEQPAGGDTLLRQERLKVERLPDMHTARAGHCVFYAGGELTVVGGHTAGFVLTPTAEYYSEGSWHLIPTVYPHDNGMSAVLGNGQRVLLAGGHEKNYLHNQVVRPSFSVLFFLNHFRSDVIELFTAHGILNLTHPCDVGSVKHNIHRMKTDDFQSRCNKMLQIGLNRQPQIVVQKTSFFQKNGYLKQFGLNPEG